MNTASKIIVSLLIAGALTLIIWAGIQILTPNEPETPERPVGATSGPDISSPYFSYGNVRHWAGYDIMENASTTCSILSPAATTTLENFTAQVDVAPTTTPQFELGLSTSAFATTTSLAKHTFTANTKRSIVATTTVTALTDHLVPPSSFLNVKQGGGGGSFVPTGNCTATFREL